MKHFTMRRSLALLLSLCLLLAFAPAAAAEEPAAAPKEPTIRFITEPKYAVNFNWFVGNYCTFFDPNANCAGICDCFGNVTMTGKNIDLEPLENGMAKEMGKNDEGYYGWAVLSPTGKRLTPYTSGGEIACAKDRYTGKVYNWVYGEFGDGERRIDVNGNDPFAGKYDSCTSIWNGKFAYSKNGKWGIDAIDGAHILPCEYGYEYLDLCGTDRCVFIQNGKWGVMDLAGKVLLPAQYDDLGYTEDIGYVVMQNGKEGFINEALEQVIPCTFDSVSIFSENVIYGHNFVTHQLAIYDAEGKEKLALCDAVSEYYGTDGVFMYYLKNSDGTRSYTVLNAAGEAVIDGKKADSGLVAAELILLGCDGSTEIYDENGTCLSVVENAQPGMYLHNIPLVCRDGLYAVIGMDGKCSTDFVYTTSGGMEKENIICMQRDDRWYFVSRSGKEYPEGGFDQQVLFDGESNYAGYVVNGYSGILRYIGADESQFTDVAKDAWYREAADFCADNGLMVGTAPGVFSPNVTTTRGMIVSLLYRLSGAEKPTGESPFTDVPDGKWYTDAVIWAAENGVVAGYGNGKFGPNDAITREQIAVIFYNYAKLAGLDISQAKALDGFPDANKVSRWSRTAVSWAVAEGLISGNVIGGKTCLDPQGKATRAMAACILMRFVKNSRPAAPDGGDIILPTDDFDA